MQEGLSFNDVLLVPKFSDVESRADADFSTRLTDNIVLRHPLISSNMDTVTEAEMAIAIGKTGGLGVIHRYMSVEQQVREVVAVKKSGLVAAAAIGVQNEDIARAFALVEAGADLLFLDIAHAHHYFTREIMEHLLDSNIGAHIIAGNVATVEGAKYLIRLGASAIKVGIGPGSVCSTRVITGCGVPQLTAIMNVKQAYDELDMPARIIADGGIQNSGDIVKAIAAGASAVMLGRLFAGCRETPGLYTTSSRGTVKVYQGMASGQRTPKWKDSVLKHSTPEGIKTTVKANGPVEEVVKELLRGLASGYSYCGAHTLEELQKHAEFIRVSSAGYAEGLPKS